MLASRAFFTKGVVALLVTLVSGCDIGGIPREQAIRLALEQSFTAGVVDTVNHGPIAQFLDSPKTAAGPDTLEVWAIRIRGGRTPGDCVIGPNGTIACSVDAPDVLVILDYRPGAFIYAEDRGP